MQLHVVARRKLNYEDLRRHPMPSFAAVVSWTAPRSRTDVVGIFPDRDALIRLVGAVLAEQHAEWAEGRRYLGLDVLARARLTTVPDTTTEETPTTIPALSA